MYTFKDQGDDLLTLRPEYTTPMIRAAITKNLLNEIPLKVYGFGPMFRRERPQKGRYRQFNQINFEIFGSNDVMSDIEIIVIADDILKSILPGCEIILNLNTLGERDNLKKYKTILSKYFNDNKNKLSEESRNKIESNPLRILDSKNENDIEISNIAPSIQDYISNKSKIQFEELKQGLKFNNIDFVINHKLVRGLDYYSETVFEFKTKNLGSQDTLLGGGRYDGLINILGGPDIPGVGWAAGIERIAMLMEFKKNTNSKVHIAINNKKFVTHLQTLFKYLKNNQISFYWNYKYNFKKIIIKS
jgi:histidyl-tRNA synthetase